MTSLYDRNLVVTELELSFVVALEEGGAMGVLLLQMHVVDLRIIRSVAAVLTNVNLRATFLVRVAVGNPMDLLGV